MYRWDVFIAYSSPDRAVADLLYQGLQKFRDAAGQPLKVCVDFKASLPGDRWMRELPAHLKDSQVVVVLCSKEATEGADYLEDEVARILDRRERDRPDRRVVPVLLEQDAELLYGLKGRQAIDGRTGVAAILSELERLFPQPINQTSDVLEAYLSDLRQTANILPAIFQPDDGVLPALSEVKVQVECRLDEQRGRLQAGRWEALARIERLEQVLDHPDHLRWTLLGKPGSGKSTLLHDLVMQGIAARKAGSGTLSRYLPLLLRLAEVEDSLKVAVEAHYPEGSWALVEEARRQGSLLVLLDGLDEVGVQGPERVRKLCRELLNCPVILSSRSTDYQPPSPDFWELRIQPLREPEQEKLLRSWVVQTPGEKDRVKVALEHLRSRKSMAILADNPLLLTLMGLVLRSQLDELPRRRADLYHAAVDMLLCGAHRRNGEAVDSSEEAKNLLGYAALRLHGSIDPATKERDRWTATQFAAVLPPERLEPWGTAEGLLQQVSARAGLLEPRKLLVTRKCWIYAHRSFQEFLAAVQFCACWRSAAPQDRDLVTTTVQKALESPAEWSEVLALSCGQLGEQADALVRRLLSEPHTTLSAEELEKKRSELLARVVAEAEGLSTDTVLAALQVDRGGGAWEKRKEKIEQLPAILGELEKMLAVLQAWLPHTRNGNDLWFIREELRKLARGEWSGGGRVEEEVRQRAATEAAGIFRHLREEDLKKAAAIICWVDVPGKGGKLEYDLGSPKEEAGRFGYESPQHLVRFVCGFEVMDAPVSNVLYECFDPEHVHDRRDFGQYGEGIALNAQDNVPAYNLTWYEAQMFSEWIATAAPGSRLPIEAEWEYFCRAGSPTAYHSGTTEADLQRAGWYKANSNGHPHAVGQKEPNAWGLHDCHGNVWEWCLDELQPYHDGALDLDPWDLGSCPTLAMDNIGNVVVRPGVRRVVRGGSWYGLALDARSAYRSYGLPDYRSGSLGFRLVRPLRRD